MILFSDQIGKMYLSNNGCRPCILGCLSQQLQRYYIGIVTADNSKHYLPECVTIYYHPQGYVWFLQGPNF